MEAAQLRELAELAHPNAMCGCGHSVRLHLVRRYCTACGCGAVRDCAEVESAYEARVAEAVARTLSPKEESGETTFRLNVSTAQKYRFGFSGFKLNKPGIVASRYRPGQLIPATGGFEATPIFAPFIEMLDTPTIDTSWGANRRQLREYLRRRIVMPPERPEVVEALRRMRSTWTFDLTTIDDVVVAVGIRTAYMRSQWSDTPEPRLVHYPPQYLLELAEPA